MKHFFSMAMALGLTIGAFAQNLVVFQVDLNDYSGSYGQVNLNGGFNGWCGGCAVMTDDDGDNVYQLEVDLAPAPTSTNSPWTAGASKKCSRTATRAPAPSTVS